MWNTIESLLIVEKTAQMSFPASSDANQSKVVEMSAETVDQPVRFHSA